MAYAIETENLTKRFGEKISVNKVSLHVKEGAIYGFIGKNGAGKTTTMKMILGLLNPTSGNVRLFGGEPLGSARKKIGSLIEAPGLYKDATALENMRRYAILYGGSEEKINAILKIVGLSDTGTRKAGKFSLGMRQRLGIALALLGDPELLVLDEPINGLDPAGIKDIRDLIVYLNQQKGVTFLISSHLLDELAKITTDYGIINEGNLVEEVSANTLRERCSENLLIRVSDPKKAVALLGLEKRGIHYEISGDAVRLFSKELETEAIAELLVKGGVGVRELKVSDGAFENYFIERI
jgi:ABC-2 type transport system ATP-binding protein